MLVVVQKQLVGKSKSSQGPARISKAKGRVRSMHMSSVGSAVSTTLPASYVQTERSGPNTWRVRGCENLGRLTTATGFKLKESYSINPLNQKLFPRLSAVALCFESYSLNKLDLQYVASCQTSLAGGVLMYYDFDPADAPKPDELGALNQTTKSACPMWGGDAQGCALRPSINEIHKNRETFFIQSEDAVLPGGNSLSAADVRQCYAGTWNVYCHDGASADVFGGYLFVDFDITFHNMTAPRPVSASWSNPTALTVDDGSYTAVPFCDFNSGVGLPGGPADQATAPWYSAGGIAGFLDGARQIYESGEWLLNLRSDVSGATYSRDKPGSAGATPHPRSSDGWFHIPPASTKRPAQEDETAVVTIRYNVPDGAPRKRNGVEVPDAAGDFTLKLSAYDVTDGVIDPDFPITSTGMTLATSRQVDYTTTAAFEASNAWNLTVPAGKRYMIKPVLSCGATAGSMRTFADLSLTANVVSALAE